MRNYLETEIFLCNRAVTESDETVKGRTTVLSFKSEDE